MALRLRAPARDLSKRCAVAALLLAFGALALHEGWIICPFACAFGIPCPGCGLTRAAERLLHADWYGAVRLHPLSPLLVPLVAGSVLFLLVDYIRGAAAPRRVVWGSLPGRSALAPLLLGLMLGVWGARFLGAWGGPVLVGGAAEPARDVYAQRVSLGSGPAGSR